MNNTGICQFCNKSCGKHVKRHIRDVHEKIKAVKCQYCDFTCTRQKTRDEAIAKGANPDEQINERFRRIVSLSPTTFAIIYAKLQKRKNS